RSLPLRHVAINFQNRRGSSVLVTPQGPPAGYDDSRAIAFGVDEFALPAPRAQQHCINLIKRSRKRRLQQFVSDLADGFRSSPAVGLLRTGIPKCDSAFRIT